MSDENKSGEQPQEVNIEDAKRGYEILKTVLECEPTPGDRIGFGAASKLGFLRTFLGKMQSEYDHDKSPSKDTVYYGAAIVIRATNECAKILTQESGAGSIAAAEPFYKMLEEVAFISCVFGSQMVMQQYRRVPMEISVSNPDSAFSTFLDIIGNTMPACSEESLRTHPFIRKHPGIAPIMASYSSAMAHLRASSMIEEICEPIVYAGAMLKAGNGYMRVDPLRPVEGWRKIDISDENRVQEFVKAHKK